MRFTKYFSATLLGLVALTACDGKEDSIYEPADAPAPGQRVYFAKASESFEVQENSESVTINVYRPEAEVADEQTVQLIAYDPSELFTVPANVVIPAGELSAPVEITYNWEALEPNKNYIIDIAIAEANANQYAVNSTKLSITLAKWSDWEPLPGESKGIGAYVFGQLYEGAEYPVQLLTSVNEADPNLIKYQLQWLDDPEDETSWSTFLSFNSEDGGKTFTVPVQLFLVHPQYGEIYVCSTQLYGDAALYVGEEEASAPSYFDEEEGVFYLNVTYYDAEEPWGIGYEYFVLDGYDEGEGDDEDSPAQVRKHIRTNAKVARTPKAKTLKF